MGHYVYKYVENGEIIYIGKNDTDLVSRIKAHKREQKFKEHSSAEVYYIELANKTESSGLEKLLINEFKPILNVLDKRDSKSIDWIPALDWHRYHGDTPNDNVSLTFHNLDRGKTSKRMNVYQKIMNAQNTSKCPICNERIHADGTVRFPNPFAPTIEIDTSLPGAVIPVVIHYSCSGRELGGYGLMLDYKQIRASERIIKYHWRKQQYNARRKHGGNQEN